MVLDAIYQGTFSVEAFSRPNDPEYNKLTKNIEALSLKVKELLGDENSSLVDELLNQVYASQCMESETSFKTGFAAGVDIQQDILKELIKIKN